MLVCLNMAFLKFGRYRLLMEKRISWTLEHHTWPSLARHPLRAKRPGWELAVEKLFTHTPIKWFLDVDTEWKWSDDTIRVRPFLRFRGSWWSWAKVKLKALTIVPGSAYSPTFSRAGRVHWSPRQMRCCTIPVQCKPSDLRSVSVIFFWWRKPSDAKWCQVIHASFLKIIHDFIVRNSFELEAFSDSWPNFSKLISLEDRGLWINRLTV